MHVVYFMVHKWILITKLSIGYYANSNTIIINKSLMIVKTLFNMVAYIIYLSANFILNHEIIIDNKIICQRSDKHTYLFDCDFVSNSTIS